MNTCGQSRCKRNPCPAPAMYPRDEQCMDNFALAMAYVPMQQFKSVYEVDEALETGTIFPELTKPFMGWKGGKSCYRT